MNALRHFVSIVLLPGTVAGLIPWWIARRGHIALTGPKTLPEFVSVIAGGVLLAVGLTLFLSSVSWFAREGRGTLAPWDPPRRLVVRGPYRYVRNPMIAGVIFTLFGEAAILRSGLHAGWALAFLVINVIYIPLLEEPMLEARFGGVYEHYCARVPRFLPRLRPWSGEG